MEVILGERAVTETMLKGSGFVPPTALEVMAPNPDTHLFWLVFDRGIWTVYGSFYGGKICTVVKFPGVSKEEWCFRSVEVPLIGKKNDWKGVSWRIMPSVNTPVEWSDLSIIAPSLPVTDGEQFELLVKKRRRSG